MTRLSALGRELKKQRQKFGVHKRLGFGVSLVALVGIVGFGNMPPAFAAYLDEMIGTYMPTSQTPSAWDNTYPFMNDNPDGLQVTLSSYQRDYNLSEQEGSAVYNASIDLAPRHLVSGFFSALSDFNKPVTVAIDFSGLLDDASEYQIADELTDAGSSVDPDKYTIEKDGNVVTITLERGLFMAELFDIMMSMSHEDTEAMNNDMMAMQEQWDIDYPDGVPDEVMRAALIALLEEHLSSYVNDADTRDWGLMYDEMMSGPSELIRASLQFSVRYPYIGPEQPDYLGDGKLTATATVCQGAGVNCEPQSYASCDELSISGTRCVRLAEYGYPTLASYNSNGWAGVEPSVSMNTSLLTRFDSANPVRYTEQMLQELDQVGGTMLTQHDTVIIGFHQSYLEDNQESSYDVNITSLLDDFDIESQFYYRYSASGNQTFIADPPDPSYGTVEIVDGHIKVWTKNVPGSEDVILGLKLTPKQTGDGIIKLTQRTCVAWPGETATTTGCVAPEQSPNAHNAGLTTGQVIYTISRYKLIQGYEVEGGGPVLPGSTVKFTTTVQNLIGTPATGAVNLDLRRLLDHVEWLDDVEVNYPQGAAGGGHWWGNLGRKKLDTYFHQLAPHASSTMSFTVKVNEDTPVGTDLDVLSWYCDPYTGCESETEMCAFDAEGSALSEVRCTGGWYSYWLSDVGVVHETEEEIAGAALFEAFIDAGIPVDCSPGSNSCSQATLTVQAPGGGDPEDPEGPGDDDEDTLDKALAVEDNPVNLDSSQQPALTVTNKPYFSGVTEKPFTTVTVTVHSDPVSCSTTSDADGKWSCTLPATIPAGAHTAYVYLTDPDTNVVTTLGPYSLMVGGGESTTITDSTKVGAPNSGVGMILDLAGSIALIAVLIIVPTGYALYYRQAVTRQ